MFWRGSARVFSQYSNLMSEKETNLKEKLKQALVSTFKVIADDFHQNDKNDKNKNFILLFF